MTENSISDLFVKYMDHLHRKIIVLKNYKEKKVILSRASENTRYEPRGQARIKRRIRKRLRHIPAEDGVLLTLTFTHTDDPEKGVLGTPRLDAWRDQGYITRATLDKIRKWRKGHWLFPIKRYVRVLEDQPPSLWPAPHIWFPGLKWLAPKKVLEKAWGQGFVDVRRIMNIAPAGYICKYITKMEGRDFMHSMTWFFGLRLFSTSRAIKYLPEHKVDTAFTFYCAVTFGLEGKLDPLKQEGYSIPDLPNILDRGG